jgi:uncharacterized Ntn-hydrolase superfamily protein
LKNTSTFVLRPLVAAAIVCLAAPSAFATWSIIALDSRSGEIVMASATCLRQGTFRSLGVKDLRDIQAVVVPGKGAGMAQAALDPSRKNQKLIEAELKKGTAPEQILTLLKASDRSVESRQFGILDSQGRSVGFTGQSTLMTALSESGRTADNIYYQIQGNILASEKVVHEASRAIERAAPTLALRVMAAMEAADAEGGDRRCTGGKTSDVAYIWIVDRAGATPLYLSVTDENIAPSEDRDPVKTLRARFNKTAR